ncbi:hypothetical protein BSKO_02858 [Bryopsis sp. KO-2023]|nr:hypothetical protein BSKO_02858 [Bryopsis sp. KO-2023]
MSENTFVKPTRAVLDALASTTTLEFEHDPVHFCSDVLEAIQFFTQAHMKHMCSVHEVAGVNKALAANKTEGLRTLLREWCQTMIGAHTQSSPTHAPRQSGLVTQSELCAVVSKLEARLLTIEKETQEEKVVNAAFRQEQQTQASETNAKLDVILQHLSGNNSTQPAQTQAPQAPAFRTSRSRSPPQVAPGFEGPIPASNSRLNSPERTPMLSVERQQHLAQQAQARHSLMQARAKARDDTRSIKFAPTKDSQKEALFSQGKFGNALSSFLQHQLPSRQRLIEVVRADFSGNFYAQIKHTGWDMVRNFLHYPSSVEDMLSPDFRAVAVDLGDLGIWMTAPLVKKASEGCVGLVIKGIQDHLNEGAFIQEFATANADFLGVTVDYIKANTNTVQRLNRRITLNNGEPSWTPSSAYRIYVTQDFASKMEEVSEVNFMFETHSLTYYERPMVVCDRCLQKATYE